MEMEERDRGEGWRRGIEDRDGRARRWAMINWRSRRSREGSTLEAPRAYVRQCECLSPFLCRSLCLRRAHLHAAEAGVHAPHVVQHRLPTPSPVMSPPTHPPASTSGAAVTPSTRVSQSRTQNAPVGTALWGAEMRCCLAACTGCQLPSCLHGAHGRKALGPAGRLRGSGRALRAHGEPPPQPCHTAALTLICSYPQP
jgi:hypothetical protein